MVPSIRSLPPVPPNQARYRLECALSKPNATKHNPTQPNTPYSTQPYYTLHYLPHSTTQSNPTLQNHYRFIGKGRVCTRRSLTQLTPTSRRGSVCVGDLVLCKKHTTLFGSHSPTRPSVQKAVGVVKQRKAVLLCKISPQSPLIMQLSRKELPADTRPGTPCTWPFPYP